MLASRNASFPRQTTAAWSVARAAADLLLLLLRRRRRAKSRLVVPAPFEEVTRIADLVSFYPEKVTITIDGEKLEPVPGQTVVGHGPDRNLSVDEIGGIQLVDDPVSTEA
jgi:hypothetical protein